MSNTVCLAPIVAAVQKSEDFLGKDRIWNAINEEQRKFLQGAYTLRQASKFSEKELRAWASENAQELNAILKRENFTIHLDEFREGEFGAVSILDVLTEWLVEGFTSTKLMYKEKEYPAVTLKANMRSDTDPRNMYECYVSRHHNFPVAMLNTKSGDRVYMTVAGRSYTSFELIHRIYEIQGSLRETVSHYESLIFPMVSLDQEVDIGWLKGMWTVNAGGQECKINQALQQTKFKMNQFGARVKSAVAVSFMITSVREPRRFLVIDQPFFLWITRSGVSTPILYAYVDEGDWKDPGDLINI